MNIVSILGSPHGMKGNTSQLLQPFVRAAKAAGATVTEFSLADLSIAPCRGCEACHRTGECPIRDDYRTVRDSLLAADGVVLASPNYMFSVTAQLKALLDRLSGPLHCQMLQNRYGAAVVTSGGGSAEVEQYLLRFLRAMGCWTVGSVSAEARELFEGQSFEQKVNAASSLGNELVQAIRGKRSYPQQTSERSEFFGRMKALILMRREDWTHEYDYWMSQNRL